MLQIFFLFDALLSFFFYLPSLTSILNLDAILFYPRLFDTQGLQLERRQSTKSVELTIGREERLNNLIYANVSFGSPAQVVKLRLSQSPTTWVSQPDPANNPCTYTNGNSLYRLQRTRPIAHILEERAATVKIPNYLNDSLYFDCYYMNWTGSYRSESSEAVKKAEQPGPNIAWKLKSDDLINNNYFVDGYSLQDVVTIDHQFHPILFIAANNFSYYPQLGLGTGSGLPGGTSKLAPGTPFMNSFSDSNELAAYSMYLNNQVTGNGQLNIGAIDVEKYSGNLTTLKTRPSSTTDAPLVTIQKIEFFNGTGTEVLLTNVTGAIGFGTEFVSGAFWAPGAIYFSGQTTTKQVSEALGSGTYTAYSTLTDKYEVQYASCFERWSGKYMSVTIDNVTIKIDASHFLIPAFSPGEGTPIMGTDGEQACRLMITDFPIATTGEPPGDYDVLLGTPFLQAAFTVFDFTNNQTSIASALFNVTDKKTIVPLKKGGVKDTPGLLHFPKDNATTTTNPPGQGSSPLPSGGKAPKKANVITIVVGILGVIIVLALFIIVAIIIKRWLRRRKPQPNIISELPGITRPIRELHESVRVMAELPGCAPPLAELPATCMDEESSAESSSADCAPSVRTQSSSVYSQPSRHSLPTRQNSTIISHADSHPEWI